MGNPYPRPARPIVRVAMAICMSTIVISSSGCGGFSGAIAGAAVEGALLGAAIGSQSEGVNWPFEASPISMELNCGAEKIMMKVSPDNAFLNLSDEFVEMKRDYTTPDKLSYFRMTPIPREEDDFIVTEKASGEFKTDWLTLDSKEFAELKFGDKTISCIVESIRPASN